MIPTRLNALDVFQEIEMQIAVSYTTGPKNRTANKIDL